MKELLQIKLSSVDPNKLNYEDRFKGELPPEAKELAEYVAKFNEKE